MKLIFSAHIDDIFLSLFGLIKKGMIDTEIIAVNTFTYSNHAESGRFPTTADIVITRIDEELHFSAYLNQRGIHYTPVFLGFKDAPLVLDEKARQAWLKKRVVDKWGERLINQRFEEGVDSTILSLLNHYKHEITSALFPVGLGHADHLFLRRVADNVRDVVVDLYLDLPFNGHRSELTCLGGKERQLTRRSSDWKEKISLFPKFYPSQWRDSLEEELKKASKVGECLFTEEEKTSKP